MFIAKFEPMSKLVNKEYLNDLLKSDLDRLKTDLENLTGKKSKYYLKPINRLESAIKKLS